jgi:hypothetical protein
MRDALTGVGSWTGRRESSNINVTRGLRKANGAEIRFGVSMHFVWVREKFRRTKLAARLGLEPRQNESESFVLPLHHRAVKKFRFRAAGFFIRGFFLRVAGDEMEPAMGFEPATACLQNRCSTVELRRRGALRAKTK